MRYNTETERETCYLRHPKEFGYPCNDRRTPKQVTELNRRTIVFISASLTDTIKSVTIISLART